MKIILLSVVLISSLTSKAQTKFPAKIDTSITIKANAGRYSLNKLLQNSAPLDTTLSTVSIDKIGYLSLSNSGIEKMPIRKADSTYTSKMPIKTIDFINSNPPNTSKKIKP